MTDRSATDLANGAIGDITADELTSTGGFLSSYLYSDPLIEVLDDEETPQYRRRAGKLRHILPDDSERPLETDDAELTETLPDEIDGRAYLLATDTRVIYVAGCADGDIVRSFPYDQLLSVKTERSESNTPLLRRSPSYVIGIRDERGAEFRTYIYDDIQAVGDYIEDRIEMVGGPDILRDELQEIAVSIGCEPSPKTVLEHGAYSLERYKQLFGSIEAAIETTDFENVEANVESETSDETSEPSSPESTLSVSREILISNLKTVHSAIDRTPTPDDLDTHSPYGRAAFDTEFESWNNALEAANITPESDEKSREELLEAFAHLWDDLGEPPSADEMDVSGQFDASAYHTRFDIGWDALPELCRDEVINERASSEIQDFSGDDTRDGDMKADVAGSSDTATSTESVPSGSADTTAELEPETGSETAEKSLRHILISELNTCSNQVEDPLTPYDLSLRGSHTADRYRRVFETWENAGDAADVSVMNPSWRDALRQGLRWYRAESDSAVVTLDELYDAIEPHLELLFPNNNTIQAKIRQQLQALRDEGDVEFLDASGTYRIRCATLDTDAADSQTWDENATQEIPDSETDLNRADESLRRDLINGLVWSAQELHQQGKTALNNGSPNRAEWQLWGAYGVLDHTAAFANDTENVHGIAARQYQISRTFNELESATVELHRDHLNRAEAAISRGIEARERDDHIDALEAFRTAEEEYAAAVDIAASHGLSTQWESEQRYSMVTEYVSETEDALSEQQEDIESGLSSADTSLTQTEQHIEVGDTVAARESLAEARTTLETVERRLNVQMSNHTYTKRYQDISDRVSAIQSSLESISHTGERESAYRSQDLIESLQVLTTTIGESPRPAIIDLCSEYPSDAYIETFGSWAAALDAANLDQIDEAARNRRKYTRVEVLTALSDLIDELGREPSRTEMNRDGAVSSTTVVNRFGDWETAVEFAADARVESNDTQETELNEEITAERDVESDSEDGKETDTISNSNDHTISASSATDVSSTLPDTYTTITAIGTNGRLDQPIPVKVRSVSDDERSRRRATVEVEDLTGEQTELNVWVTHDVTVEWQPGEWYIFKEVLGKSWTNSAGEMNRNLSTTADFTAEHIGERPIQRESNTDTPTSTETVDTSTAPDTDTPASESNSDDSETDILDQIEGELKNL